MSAFDVRDTRMLLEFSRAYESARFMVLSFAEEELELPATVPGKLKMLQDGDYLRFKYTKQATSEGSGCFCRIDSMALTPKGELLLTQLNRDSAWGRLRTILVSVGASVITTILTLLALRWVGLSP